MKKNIMQNKFEDFLKLRILINKVDQNENGSELELDINECFIQMKHLLDEYNIEDLKFINTEYYRNISNERE